MRADGVKAPVEISSFGDLQCPRGCSHGGNLHHGRVETFERRREDDANVLRTTIDRRTASVDYISSTGSGNPSSRRDGLRINFYCEQCGDGLILNIAQHKGATLVEWTINQPEFK